MDFLWFSMDFLRFLMDSLFLVIFASQPPPQMTAPGAFDTFTHNFLCFFNRIACFLLIFASKPPPQMTVSGAFDTFTHNPKRFAFTRHRAILCKEVERRPHSHQIWWDRGSYPDGQRGLLTRSQAKQFPSSLMGLGVPQDVLWASRDAGDRVFIAMEELV